MKSDRIVTERDLRRPEFREGNPEDYEFREDGVIMRKDRWERGIRRIADALGKTRSDFEIDDIVAEVRALVSRVNALKTKEDSISTREDS